MNDKEMIARESLLRAAHTTIGESISDRLPGPNDDAQNEYIEDTLIATAREFANATRSRNTITGSPYDGQIHIDESRLIEAIRITNEECVAGTLPDAPLARSEYVIDQALRLYVSTRMGRMR
jgi:hypothetical protein